MTGAERNDMGLPHGEELGTGSTEPRGLGKACIGTQLVRADGGMWCVWRSCNWPGKPLTVVILQPSLDNPGPLFEIASLGLGG